MKSRFAMFRSKSIPFKMRLISIVCAFAIVISLSALVFEFFWLRDTARMIEAEESIAVLPGGIYQMKQLERKIERFGWHHDDSFRVMYYGDEHWMGLVMPYVERNDYLGCSRGHKDEVMSYITCHAPPVREFPETASYDSPAYAAFAEAHAAFWNEWWRENKHKTQRQWVQSGLATWGLHVEKPVNGDNVRDLLLAIGRRALYQKQRNAEHKADKSNPSADLGAPIKREDILPPFVTYNAARWLRDFGGLGSIFELTSLANLSEQDRLLLKHGVSLYENQLLRNIRCSHSLDEHQRPSDDALESERWKNEPIVLAQRIIPPASVILLLASTCGLAWTRGNLKGKDGTRPDSSELELSS